MSGNEAQTTLIPTGTRSDLPRGLSHPVGAEIISKALFGCPQYDRLWIAFGDRSLPLHPAPERYVNYKLAFSVIFNGQSDSWYLNVPAVPGGERAIARELLMEAGLAGALEWLAEPRPETWQVGFRSFQVGYLAEPRQICFVESLNHKVIGSSLAAAGPNNSFKPKPLRGSA